MHCAEKPEIRVIMAIIFLSTCGNNLEIITYESSHLSYIIYFPIGKLSYSSYMSTKMTQRFINYSYHSPRFIFFMSPYCAEVPQINLE